MLSLFRSSKPVKPAPDADAVLSKGTLAPSGLPIADWHQHRYPPAPVGIPLYDPDSLLDLHPELIYSIRLASGLNDTDFSRHYLKVCRNYAHFVHVLPASRAHHHRNVGGLLRHGLEVCVHALRKSDTLMLGTDRTPNERFTDEPVWRFGIFCAAISHDLGKAVADIEVFDHTGTLRWNPFQETLVEWGQRNHLTTYHPRWVSSRVHQAHEAMAAVLLSRILDVSHYAYLAGASRDILLYLVNAVSGKAVKNENPLHTLVTAADAASVSASLKSDSRLVEGVQVGLSPAERFMEAAARFILDDKEQKIVNTPSAYILVGNQGCFMRWPQMFNWVKSRLAEEGVNGIFTTPDNLANLLLETRFAVINPADNTDRFLYHRVAPVFPQSEARSPTNCIKIRSPELLFASALPPPIELEIIDQPPKASDAPSSQDPRSIDEQNLQRDPAESPPTEHPASGQEYPEAPPDYPPPEPAQGDPLATEDPSQPRDSDKEIARQSLLLLKKKAVGQTLLAMVEAANNGELKPGRNLFLEKTDLYFGTTALSKVLGMEIKEIGDLLDQDGTLIVDPRRPTTRFVRYQTGGKSGVNAFHISAHRSKAMCALLDPSVREKIGFKGEPWEERPSQKTNPPAEANSHPTRADNPSQPGAPAPPAKGEQSKASVHKPEALNQDIRTALNGLASEEALPEGIVRVDGLLVGNIDAFSRWIKGRIPDAPPKSVYTQTLQILMVAESRLVARTNEPAGAKLYRYGRKS